MQGPAERQITSVDQRSRSRLDPSPEIRNGLERRKAESDSEMATRILHRAVGHLLWERERAEYLDIEDNEAAVEMLCGAAQEVAKGERRQGVRRSTLDWLQDAIRLKP